MTCFRCTYCNINKTNDIGQVWCIKLNSFVDLSYKCDYFEKNADII